MYHKLPIGGVAAGGGLAAASGIPTLMTVGIALMVAAGLLGGVTFARRLRRAGRHH